MDSRKEIAVAALTSLRSTIPQAKHADTVVFARVSIIDYIETHLSSLMDRQGSMLNKAPSSEEDSESFGRIVATNLGLLSHLVELLSAEQMSKISEKLASLLDTHVWRMLKASDPKIRGAVYGLCSSLIRQREWTTPRLTQLVPVIFNSITDADPSTHAKSWGCLVAFLSSYPISGLNGVTSATLLTPLTQAMKAQHASPAAFQSLLPLLSTLPLEFLNAISNTFFTELWRALKSSTCPEVIVSTYFECLIFIISRVETAQQNDLLEKHFLPIFTAFFAYEKSISSNIASDMALFVSRIGAKSSLRGLAQRIWTTLETESSKSFAIGTNTPTSDSQAIDLFSIKLEQFVANFEHALRESERSGDDLFNHFLSLLLTPTIATLFDTQLLEQIRCIASLGPIWRAIPSLGEAQERKRAEAADFLATRADAPHFIADLVMSPLKSSTATDNSDWRTLLRGLIQQKDTAKIVSFINSHSNEQTPIVPSGSKTPLSVSGNLSMGRSTDSLTKSTSSAIPITQPSLPRDPAFWRCAELDNLAFSQATIEAVSLPANSSESQYGYILPFLLDYVSDEAVLQVCTELIKVATSSKSDWTLTFMENLLTTIEALCRVLADLHVDFTLVLNLAFDWCLITDQSLPLALQTPLKQKSLAMLESILARPSCVNINPSHLVSLVRSQLSDIMNGATTSDSKQLIEHMSELISRLIGCLSNNSALSSQTACLDLLSRLMLTDEEWGFILRALSSQRKTDTFARNVLATETQSASSPTSPSASALISATGLLEYAILTLSKVPNLDNVIGAGSDRCDARLVSQVSRLLVCKEVLSTSPASHRNHAASDHLHQLDVLLSSLLNDKLLPTLLLRTNGFASQLLAHSLSNYDASGTACAQIDTVLEFCASSAAENKSTVIAPLWAQVSSLPTKQFSLIASFNSNTWLDEVDATQLGTTISKSLSDLYQLKAGADLSNVELLESIGYQFLVTSALVPASAKRNAVDSRKLMEVFSFGCKAAFAIFTADSTFQGHKPAFLVGLLHFVSEVILNSNIKLALSEANYALVFDLMARLTKFIPLNDASSVTAESYALMFALDAVCDHVSKLGSYNADWADFLNTCVGPLCKSWTDLSHSSESWPESYVRHWARVMRFLPSNFASRLDGESVTQLYNLIRTSTSLQVQSATFPMLLAVIREHNSNTFTHVPTHSHHLPDASSSDLFADAASSSTEVLESAVLSDALQHLVTDLDHGYVEPFDLEDIDASSSADRHVLLASTSLFASTLFGWRIILEYMNSKDEKERNDVSTWIRLSSLLSALMPVICHLIDLDRPKKILIDPLLETHLTKTAYGSLHEDPKESLIVATNAIESIAYYVLRDLFELVPVLMRSWWQQIDTVLQNRVENFISRTISPQLIARELERVQSWKGKPMDDFSLKAASIGEVVASYVKDEVELQMTLKLSTAHPLKPVTVTMSHMKAVSESLWRKWLLSMRSLLMTKDGTVLDAVLLWRDYLDRHFDGVDCCPICYAIFHISNYSLPDLACKTCRNKFHRACLYKWFNSSHHNECPLCKTPFN